MSFNPSAILLGAAQEATQEVKLDAFANIPAGSVISVINIGAEWREYEGVQSINLQWEITAPEALKGRKIFHGLKVYEKEFPVKMLAGIYYQALKKPYPYGGEFPNSTQLEADLRMKAMNLSVEEWEMNGKTGNWYNGVSAYDEKSAVVGNSKPKAPQQQQSTQQHPNFDGVDDDIPF